jgi:hypothetical protein
LKHPLFQHSQKGIKRRAPLVIFFFFIGIIGILVYFIPTMIAIARKHKNALAIFLVNFFLGWSFIGWVVALVWAVAR